MKTLAFLLLGQLALAQGQAPVLPSDSHRIEQQGNLFQVTLVPKEKRLQVFVAGKKWADTAQPSQVKVAIHGRALPLSKEQNYFQTLEDINDKRPLDVDVQVRKGKSGETFHFKVP